jgi:hypothetical protein
LDCLRAKRLFSLLMTFMLLFSVLVIVVIYSHPRICREYGNYN